MIEVTPWFRGEPIVGQVRGWAGVSGLFFLILV